MVILETRGLILEARGLILEARGLFLESRGSIARISGIVVIFRALRLRKGSPILRQTLTIFKLFAVLFFFIFFRVLVFSIFCDFRCPEAPFL